VNGKLVEIEYNKEYGL